MPSTQTQEVMNLPAPEFQGIGGGLYRGAQHQLIGPQGPKSYAQMGGPMQRLTQMTGPESMGYAQGIGRAMGPNPYPQYADNYASSLYGNQMGMAGQNYMDTLGGRYMSPESNPYLSGAYSQAASAMTDQFRNEAIPGLNAAFSQGGATGGSAHRAQAGRAADALAGSMGNLANQMYGGAYQQERGLQAQLAGDVMGRAQQMAPQLGQLRNLGFQDAETLRKYGSDLRTYQDQRNQQDFANRMASFQYEQGVYPQLANLYAALTKGTGMQTSTSTIPMLFDNPVNQAMGVLSSLGPVFESFNFGGGGKD